MGLFLNFKVCDKLRIKRKIEDNTLLEQAGFVVQDRVDFNRLAIAPSVSISAVAVREFVMNDKSEVGKTFTQELEYNPTFGIVFLILSSLMSATEAFMASGGK